jgi:hypothetical protein
MPVEPEPCIRPLFDAEMQTAVFGFNITSVLGIFWESVLYI